MKCNHIIFKLIFLLAFSFLNAQEIIPLYDGNIPNSKPSDIKESGEGMYRNVTNPTLEYFKPNLEKANGMAIILVPGGGYSVVVYQGEGVGNAKALTEQGIAVFILKARHHEEAIMIDKKRGPLQDEQKSIKIVREKAKKWGIDTSKCGIMGFSAGGHLAASAATHFETSYIDNPKNTSLRPDFQILVYPVISMTSELTHGGSRDALLGKNPTKEDIQLFSNEQQVKANTPPAYLTHTADDTTVDVDNSIVYFESLRHNKVDAEMHIYTKGGHGFIFRHQGWMDPLFAWMKRNNWIK